MISAATRIRPIPQLAVFVLAFLVRAPFFGDAAVDHDEQFYFLVGSRMLEGQWPYVDIWDRKPVLIFAVNAVASAVGGGNPLVLQMLAAAAAGLAAVQILRIARYFAATTPGMVAAALFLLSFPLLWSPGAQSEVFFIPVLLAMLQVTIRICLTSEPRRVFALSCWLMLLGGNSLQFKYTTLPCCIVAAAAVLLRARILGRTWPQLGKDAALFAAIGLAPTLAVAAIYAGTGHFQDFWFANFASIFRRGGLSGQVARSQAYNVAFYALMPTAMAAVGLLRFTRQSHSRAAGVAYACAAGYTAAALAGFAMVGMVYSHYFLPVVPGLVLLAVPVFARGRTGMAIGIVAVATSAFLADFPAQVIRAQQDERGLRQAVALIGPHIGKDRCLFVYDGPAVLYQLTRSCLPGRHVYPDHLNNAQEKHAIGIDQTAEVGRILSHRPGAIVVARGQVVPGQNAGVASLMARALVQDYRLIGRVTIMGRPTDIHALK